ncbi:MAG: prenyltransferase [Candidatus Omnitrophota bacterium]|jgi:1,4-dihydroxy-2-naphthoate octaprenyltransferase
MARQTLFFVKDLARALRLPFIAASALPFIFGSIAAGGRINILNFLLGLSAVTFTHLSANVINDYADSRSGADWRDKKFFGFFGGSKLIQEGVFTEKFYLSLAIISGALSFSAVAALAFIIKDIFPVVVFLAIIFLGWSYSMKPLKLSYRGLGEIIIFLLFGPALVMGGYFLQTGLFPDLKSFLLSLPFGFLTTAVLYANEVPDMPDDSKAGKFTWVSIFGSSRAYIFYRILVACVFLCVILNVTLGHLKPTAFFCFLLIPPLVKASEILKNYPEDKIKLMESSKFTIASQAAMSLILIIITVL